MKWRKRSRAAVQTDVLQQEIREAGIIARDLRASWKAFAICVMSVLALAALATALSSIGTVVFVVTMLLGLVCIVMSVLLIILPVTACYREWRTHGIRRAIVALSPDERAAALEPLRKEESPETRELAAALLLEFGGRAEVTPAPAPDARGDEPSAVD